jgi:2-polyprenyl-6-methoxyphenol hydroxylase-like FAD-dependent oxidoreductase
MQRILWVRLKGQGANQALLDALALARTITRALKSIPLEKEKVRKSILANFEQKWSNTAVK